MYSPKIDEELIPELYRQAKKRKVPMTRLVNEFLRKAIGECEESPPVENRGTKENPKPGIAGEPAADWEPSYES